MRLERAGLGHAQGDGLFGVLGRAVFAAPGQKADRVLEMAARQGQVIGQVEHRLVLPVSHRQPQVRVENGQRLTDQVQPRPGQVGANLGPRDGVGVVHGGLLRPLA